MPSPGAPRTWTLELPPGLELLSLNKRYHWAARARLNAAWKKAAWVTALQDKVPHLDRVTITAEYQPPDLRRRDPDNASLALKACIDGLVAARVLDGDDSRYVTYAGCTIGSLWPKGRLLLHITEVTA